MRVYPREWFRKDAIEYAKARIQEGDSFLTIGMPGVGKTSFLKMLHVKLRKLLSVRSFMVDLNELGGISDDIVSRHIASVISEGQGDNILEIADEIGDRREKVVLIVDRFEKTAYKVTRDFFDLLRVVVERSKHKLVFVLASSRELTELFGIDEIDQFYSLVNPFTLYLKPFSRKEAMEYIRMFSDKREVSLSDEQVASIVNLTGGHSRMINAYVSHIDISNGDVSVGDQIEAASNSHAVMYQCQRILTNLSNNDRNTLYRVATGLELFDRDKQNLKHLIDLGVVNEPLDIFSKRFCEFVREQVLHARGRLYLDQDTGEIFLKGVRIDTELSPYEYRFLEYMYENAGQIVDREDVIETVWGVSKDQGVSDEAVDQLVSRLREKIEEDKSQPKHLITVRGRGFQLKLN